MNLREEFEVLHLEEDLVLSYLEERNLIIDFNEWKEKEFQTWVRVRDDLF